VEHLLQADVATDDWRLSALLARLPQLPLFQILVEERQLPDWSPQNQEDAQRARIWQGLAGVAREEIGDRPAVDLVRYLLTRSTEDDGFARRHAALVRAAVLRADRRDGGDLVDHLERLTRRASEDKVARLAQLLVDLCERLDGESEDRARSLLERWKGRSTGLRLRIYQMQNKLGR